MSRQPPVRNREPSARNREPSARNNEPRASRGAVASNTGYGDLIRAWRQHHVFSAGDAGKRLAVTPIQTLMTTLVVAIALALPATLLLVLSNLTQLGERWDATPHLSVYLHVRAKPAAVEALQGKLQDRGDISEVIYISPEQALAGFEAQSGFSDVLGGLEHNPLPPTLVITPALGHITPDALDTLAEQLRSEPIVESVDLDMAWVRRLHAIMALGQKVVLALAALLGLGVLLAIGNTIRLNIENRRDEILVTKLVGGTNGFVRRPFLYSGAWYGLAGGVLACILVTLGFNSLQAPVAQLASAYNTSFPLRGLGIEGCLLLLATGTLLGWLGAWLAVGRHLHHLEPR